MVQEQRKVIIELGAETNQSLEKSFDEATEAVDALAREQARLRKARQLATNNAQEAQLRKDTKAAKQFRMEANELNEELIDVTHSLANARLDVRKFGAELRKSRKNVQGVTTDLGSMEDRADRTALALGGVSVAILGIGGLALRDSIEDLREMDFEAHRAGISLAEAQETYALFRAAGSRDAIGNIGEIAEVGIRITEALEDSESDLAGFFKQVGIGEQKLKELQAASPAKQFEELINVLRMEENQSIRNTLADEIFAGTLREQASVLLNSTDARYEQIKANKAYIESTQLTAENQEILRKQTEELSLKNEALKNQLMSALIPVLLDVSDTLTPIIQDVVNWSKENPELVRGVFLFAGVLGVTAVAIKTTLFFMSLWKTAALIYTTVTGGMTAATTAFTISLGPIALIALVIIASLAAIGVAAYLLIKNWDDVKEATIRTWEEIQLMFERVKAFFMAGYNFLIDLGAGYIGFWLNMVRTAINAINAIPIIPDIDTGFIDKAEERLQEFKTNLQVEDPDVQLRAKEVEIHEKRQIREFDRMRAEEESGTDVESHDTHTQTNPMEIFENNQVPGFDSMMVEPKSNVVTPADVPQDLALSIPTAPPTEQIIHLTVHSTIEYTGETLTDETVDILSERASQQTVDEIRSALATR